MKAISPPKPSGRFIAIFVIIYVAHAQFQYFRLINLKELRIIVSDFATGRTSHPSGACGGLSPSPLQPLFLRS
jgi:hypothetical protein